ncbi:MAG: hypothetical protein Q9175_005240 [Cornicularia normoerica]
MSAAREVDANRGESTSPGLSSPPSPNSPTRQTATPTGHSHANVASLPPNSHIEANDGGAKSAKSIGAKTAAAPLRKPRKKKEPESKPASNNSNNSNNNGNASTATDGQEQRLKKTRAARGTSEQFKRRQQKQLEKQQAAREAEALQVARQLKITESLSPRSPLPPTNLGVPAIHASHQNGNSEAIPTTQVHSHQIIVPTTRPASGQNYDPIRSSTVAPRPSSPLATTPMPQRPYKYPSASASPSIHSIFEQTSTPPLYSYHQPPKRENDAKAPSPPEPKRPRLSPPLPATTQQSARPSPRDIAPAIPNTSNSNTFTIMDMDTDKPSAPVNKTTNHVKKPSPNASTAVSSSSHSPKPGRPKEAQVAISSGSGLLSGSIFGGGIDSTAPEKTAPTVVLNVPLTGDNQYVNFTRLAEERYGFNALHPRLAAQRERLARVAAAGAALENANKSGGNFGSGDEMSVDLSDGEADNSNVEIGGVNDGERTQKSGEETGEAGVVKKPRKRTMKEDMYDKEDDFIDDTEMIWEEQAAASKDGFFVYSGPLVPPGQEPQVERADGLPKRGRGSGRGRGGATRGAARAAANPKDGAKVPVRKPRVTKAAKEQMEREKAQRENSLAVLASKPALTSAPA